MKWLAGLVHNKEVWFTSRKCGRINQKFFTLSLSRKVETAMRKVFEELPAGGNS